METTIHSFKRDIAKLKNIQHQTGQFLSFDEALDMVRSKLSEKWMKLNIQADMSNSKTKEEFRQELEKNKDLISDIVFGNSMKVRGYEDEKIHDFIRDAAHEFVGYSVLADAFEDAKVSDIFVVSWDLIIVEKDGENEVYHRTFNSKEHLDNTIARLIRVNGKEINNGDKKIVHFELFGDRGCAIASKVSTKGFSLTIRKHAEDHIKLHQVIEAKVLTQEMADLFGQIVLGESNVIYGGLTGSGKTTTIRAILDEYLKRANKRALICEDTQELFLEHEHTVPLLSTGGKQGDAGVVTLYDIILTALRLKPKYIIIGEVRGGEAVAAVEGMETGHSTVFTMHGGNTWNIINRLVTKYLMGMPSLSVPIIERIIGSSLDYVCIQDNIPGIGRRLTSFDEIGFDFEKNTITIRPIYRYDIIKQEFVFVNKITREKAMNMMRRGVKWDDIKYWVEEEKAHAV